MDSPKEREEPLAFALSSHWKTKTRANFMAERFQVRDNGELTGVGLSLPREGPGKWEHALASHRTLSLPVPP